MGFTVRATDTASMAGSVSELNKKARGSVTSLKQVGGSLLSLGGKEKKNLARLASAVSGKVEKVGNKAKKTVSSLKLNKDTKDKALDTVTEWGLGAGAGRNQDPGVESDEEEEYGGLGELGDTVIRHPRHQDLLSSRYSHTQQPGGSYLTDWFYHRNNHSLPVLCRLVPGSYPQCLGVLGLSPALLTMPPCW